MTVRVICDTACDLPQELAQSYGISLVPLHVRFGSKEFVDREELSTKDFWRLCSSSGDLPETAAPAPGAFHAAFESAAASGASAVLCVTISSRLSATFDSASQAAAEMGPALPVEVFDSRSVTMGEGLVAVAAAEAAREGNDLAGVLSAAESTRRRLFVFGAIDTLENLRRGGRIGGAAAALGALLSIKPVIEVRDGVVEEESKQRTRGRSLRYLASKLRAAGPVERLAIMGAEAADFDEFVALTTDIGSLKPKILADIGPVVGTHAGPGAIGVAWVTASPEP